MPTERLYYQDQYMREFTATVASVEQLPDGRVGVMLDRTAFYPEGGGQPADTGVLEGPSGRLKVVWAESRGEDVLHMGELEGSLSVGDEVRGTLDWERRYAIMRTHTAAHVLMHAVDRLFGRTALAGSGLSVGSGRLDFAAKITRDRLPAIEEKANEIVRADAEVRAHVLPREKAGELLARYGAALGPAQQEMEEIRVVEIVGVGADPCGGTHVARTGEIGGIKILKRKSKGKGVVRLEYAVSGFY